MATTLTLTRITGPVETPLGLKPEAGRIRFTLLRPDIEGDTVVAPVIVETMLDSEGDFSADLWCSSEGETGSAYDVSIGWWDAAVNTRIWRAIGYVAPSYSASDQVIADLLTVAAPDPTPTDLLAAIVAAASATAANAAVAEADAARAEAAAAAINIQSVTDDTAIAALDTSQWSAAHRQDYGITYDWDASDLSAKITASDPRYVAPALAPTGASGAWKRAGSQVNTWAPVKWPSVDGSLYSGPIAHVWHRTGGYGPYGLALLQLSDDDELPTGELSNVLAAWGSAKNQTGGTMFGAWIGANSPNFEQAGHAWTAGALVGTEINAGIRALELGLIGDIGGAARWSVGLQVVPDVLPADGMSPPAGIFHGSFGIAVHQSIHGHKWHTGFIASADTIVAGGFGMKLRGGSVLGNAPSHGLYFDGYHTNGIVIAGNLTDAFAITGTATRGINLSAGSFTTAIRMAAGHGISWGSGGAQLSTTGGSVALSTGNADDDFAVYANNFATRLISGDATGGVARTSVNGNTPVPKASFPGAATDPATTQALANALRTALINFGIGA